MTKALTILIASILVVSVAVPAVAQGEYPGVVTIDSVEAGPSESVAVKIWLRDNDIAVSAMTLPLKFSSPALTLDSVSLNNSVWTSDFAGYFVIDNDDRTTRITVLPDDMIYPLPAMSFSEGVVAELFFTVAATVTPHRVALDSVYADSSLGNDIHVYTRIDLSDNTGTGVFLPDFVPGEVNILVPTGVDDDPGGSTLPSEFALEQNYPNPFNPTTVMEYAVPTAGFIRIEVFNILGQQMITLFEGRCEAGRHTVTFDGANLPSGIYFYRLKHEGGSQTRKMILVK